MIEVRLDGETVEASLTGRERVGDVVGSMARYLDDKRCVISVRLDEEDITGVADRHQEPIGTYRRLDVKTGKKSDLALDSLASIEEFHESLIQEFGKAAQEFRIGNEEKSNQIFVRCLDGIEVVMRTTYTVANLLNQRREDVETPQGSLVELNQRVNSLFDEMIEAQTQRDSILIADLIEYELVPLLEDWRMAFKFMRKTETAA